MEEIPVVFWMIIISGLSTLFGVILFYLGMLLRESMLTVREFRGMMVEAYDVLDAAKSVVQKANDIMSTVKITVKAVSESIIQPINTLKRVFDGVQSWVSNYFGGSDSLSETDRLEGIIE